MKHYSSDVYENLWRRHDVNSAPPKLDLCAQAVSPGSSIFQLSSLRRPADTCGSVSKIRRDSLRENQGSNLGVKSSDRTLDILSYFNWSRRPAKAIEISQELGLPRSSCHEILTTLVCKGYLVRDSESKRYFPSMRIIDYASWLSQYYFGSGKLRSLIEKIYCKADMAVTISTQNHNEMQVMALMSEATEEVIVVAEGGRYPILDSASGCALLMTWPDERIIQMIRTVTLRSKLNKAHERCRAFLSMLSEFRAQGYAVVSPSARISAVAAPTPPSSVGVQFVVGVGGDPSAVQGREKELGEMLKCEIQATLG